MRAPTAPRPVAPKSSHTDVVWRPCWWCGLPLLDDENDLCEPCNIDLNPMGAIALHAVADRRGTWTATLSDAETVHDLTAAAVDQHVELVETRAAAWAAEHDLDDQAAGEYRGRARGRALERLQARGQRELEALGEGRMMRAVEDYRVLLRAAGLVG